LETTTDTTIIRSLFDPIAHEAIKAWLAERVPMLSLGVPLMSDEDQPDSNRFNRRYAHNPPFLTDIHRQLTGYASELFGVKVIPSYVFLSMYGDQGICPLHIDRSQCFRTIDYLVDQDVDADWPIHIGPMISDKERDRVLEAGEPVDDKAVERIKKAIRFDPVVLSPNDAVAYSGTHQWHYRDRIQGRSATLVFFHFVEEGFDGALD
jgi:hypothetical protein